MEIVVQKSFEKYISSKTDKKLASQILSIIGQLEICQSFSEINHVKKLKESRVIIIESELEIIGWA